MCFLFTDGSEKKKKLLITILGSVGDWKKKINKNESRKAAAAWIPEGHRLRRRRQAGISRRKWFPSHFHPSRRTAACGIVWPTYQDQERLSPSPSPRISPATDIIIKKKKKTNVPLFSAARTLLNRPPAPSPPKSSHRRRDVIYGERYYLGIFFSNIVTPPPSLVPTGPNCPRDGATRGLVFARGHTDKAAKKVRVLRMANARFTSGRPRGYTTTCNNIILF